MVRCADFYKRWEKDPNWCEKAKSSVQYINSYLDLVHEIETRGIDREIIYAKMPEGAARPVIQIKDPETRVKILNYICGALGRSERIYPTELKNLVAGYEGKTKPEKHVEDRGNVSTNVEKGAQDEPESANGAQSEKQNLEPAAPANASPFKTARQIRDGIAGEMFPQEDSAPLPPLPPDAPMKDVLKRDEELLARTTMTRQNGDPDGFHRAGSGDPSMVSTQGIPRRTTRSPNEFTIITTDAQRDVLRQAVRSGLADSMEDAILMAIDEMGRGIAQ